MEHLIGLFSGTGLAILAIIVGFIRMAELSRLSRNTTESVEAFSSFFHVGFNVFKSRYIKIVGWITLVFFLINVLIFSFFRVESGHLHPVFQLLAFLFGFVFSGVLGLGITQFCIRRIPVLLNLKRDALIDASYKVAQTAGLFLVGVTVLLVSVFQLYIGQFPLSFIAEHLSLLLSLCLGVTLNALILRVAGGWFAKTGDMTSDLTGLIEYNFGDDSLQNPLMLVDQMGDHITKIWARSVEWIQLIVYVLVMTLATLVRMNNGFGSDTIYHFMDLHIELICGGLILLILNVKSKFLSNWIMLLYMGYLFMAHELSIELAIVAVLGLVFATLVQYFNTRMIESKTVTVMESASNGVLPILLKGVFEGIQFLVFPGIVFVLICLGCFRLMGVNDFLGWGMYGIMVFSVVLLSVIVWRFAYTLCHSLLDNVLAWRPFVFQNTTEQLDDETAQLIRHTLVKTNVSSANSQTLGYCAAFIVVLTLFYEYLFQIGSVFMELMSAQFGLDLSSQLSSMTSAIQIVQDQFQTTIVNAEFVFGIMMGITGVVLLVGKIIRRLESLMVHSSDMMRTQLSRGAILAQEELPDYLDPVRQLSMTSFKFMWPFLLSVFLIPFITALVLGVSGVIGFILGFISLSFVVALCAQNVSIIWANSKLRLRLLGPHVVDTPDYISLTVTDLLGDMFKDLLCPALITMSLAVIGASLTLTFFTILVDPILF